MFISLNYLTKGRGNFQGMIAIFCVAGVYGHETFYVDFPSMDKKAGEVFEILIYCKYQRFNATSLCY